jgi:hypothetical protein
VLPPAYAVLAEVSLGYPPQQGRFPRATHPCATHPQAKAQERVRLACVKHAASVRSEPGSNSHVQSSMNPTSLNARPTDLTDPPRVATRQTGRQGPSQRLLQTQPPTGTAPRAGVTTTQPPPAHPFLYQQCQSTGPVEPARRSGPRRRGRRLISPSPGQGQRPFDGSCRASHVTALPCDRSNITVPSLYWGRATHPAGIATATGKIWRDYRGVLPSARKIRRVADVAVSGDRCTQACACRLRPSLRSCIGDRPPG